MQNISTLDTKNSILSVRKKTLEWYKLRLYYIGHS